MMRRLNAGLSAVRWLAGWLGRHGLAVPLFAALLAGLSVWRGWPIALVALALVPVIGAVAWRFGWPAGYERFAAGPARRRAWCREAAKDWPGRCRAVDLSRGVLVQERRENGEREEVRRMVPPGLKRVRAHGDEVGLLLELRQGQTITDVSAALPRLVASLGAVAGRVEPVAGSGVQAWVNVSMRDSLGAVRTAGMPEVVQLDAAALGRAQGGRDWRLPLVGRHTLIVGCSGAGKGSVMWGIARWLAPAVHEDRVRLWGIDLKRGVELSLGAGLFSTVAASPADALGVLRHLLGLIEQRGTAMAAEGVRLHEPVPGDPLHVLVVDELAALVAYSDRQVRDEANRLLSEILTQGRALGVIVVGCVQDPRKETIGLRGLFTQTVALRLRSADETRMVLGDGMAARAPAHEISPADQGKGYVVDDGGNVDQVRADWVPDELIREMATSLATKAVVEVEPAEPAPSGRSSRRKSNEQVAGVDRAA